ncbi:MAG: 50S ribosomal protein L33 [candidate division WS2 bacterium ADurb.Bin280]|uniref:Large ribosomal subunit protein bL33 n=1 Tax=candidate division WS2 bacterium ADurb.Bin280 TaxID=1852829 RepID=A0A1V5SEL0_9BACT|nr:MAG: 50S ribosomal protein L33 [candidate division WS2 bacterium ADurb.Bin280]
MAKKGTRLNTLVLECSVCASRNYITQRSNIQPVKKIEIKKHCPKCKKHTVHKEGK